MEKINRVYPFSKEGLERMLSLWLKVAIPLGLPGSCSEQNCSAIGQRPTAIEGKKWQSGI